MLLAVDEGWLVLIVCLKKHTNISVLITVFTHQFHFQRLSILTQIVTEKHYIPISSSSGLCLLLSCLFAATYS